MRERTEEANLCHADLECSWVGLIRFKMDLKRNSLHPKDVEKWLFKEFISPFIFINPFVVLLCLK
jgi:hypothetical protein